MTDDPVLVLTCLDDPTADVVIGELGRRGVPVVRADPGEVLTGGLWLSARLGLGMDHPTGSLETATRVLDLTRVRSVWHRRPTPYEAPPGMSPTDGAFSVQQARYGLGGVLSALACQTWVNHIWSTVQAEYKPAQLAAAVRAGMLVPPTLLTNKLAEARRFVECFGPVLYKPLSAGIDQDETGVRMVWARAVDAGELDEQVELTVHQFQAQVDKTGDVRLTVIGDRCFAVRIDSPLLDWRADYDQVRYTVVDTPAPIRQACRDYMRGFGLRFAAFDFAIGPDGTWVFLECNTAGQWYWLEEFTGLPMAAALADLLEGI